MSEIISLADVRPPASWDDASIVGVYVGIESIGRTYVYVQVRDMVTMGAE